MAAPGIYIIISFYVSSITQHNFKKLRNSLLKSGMAKDDSTEPKKVITKDGVPILWKHWMATYLLGCRQSSNETKLSANHGSYQGRSLLQDEKSSCE